MTTLAHEALPMAVPRSGTKHWLGQPGSETMKARRNFSHFYPKNFFIKRGGGQGKLFGKEKQNGKSIE